MRLLQVITSLRIGGAERLITELLPRFKEHGIETELALFDATPTQFLYETEAAGIKIHKFGYGFKSIYNPLNILKLHKLISSNHYDIVHTHNSSCQIYTAIANSLNRHKTSLVTTEHNTTNRRRSWKWFHGIDRWMYNQYDSIVCCSNATRTNLTNAELVLKPEQLTTIYNGVTLSSDKNGNFDSKGRNIVMVSAFRPQKDHITAIKAMTHLPDDFNLYFAGEGVTMESVKDFVKENHLDDRIHFLGNVTDVQALYRSAHCAVLSTHYEGMPLSIIEAMASGTPIIASDVPGVTELVSDAGILFPDSDEKALAEAIIRITDNPKERSKLISAGLNRASQYDIENTAKKYITLYNNLISKRK